MSSAPPNIDARNAGGTRSGGAQSDRATIHDVADAAGVSIATVSGILNGSRKQTFSETTSVRVREAAARLGYSANPFGRSLREGHSRIVLIHLRDLDQPGAVLGQLLEGMGEELRIHGHTLVVTTGSETSRRDAVRAIAPRTVIDIAPDGGPDSHAAQCLASLLCGNAGSCTHHSRIQFEYLVAKGHRRIAFAVSHTRWSHLDPGAMGAMQQVARQLGVAAPEVIRFDGQDPARIAEVLQLSGVTAVAVDDDVAAISLLSAAGDRGLSIPDDLAVLGFGDTAVGALWRPRLSTVRVRADECGRRAARAILGLEIGNPAEPAAVVVTRQTA